MMASPLIHRTASPWAKTQLELLAHRIPRACEAHDQPIKDLRVQLGPGLDPDCTVKFGCGCWVVVPGRERLAG